MPSIGLELIFPPNCKPINGDLSKEELRRRLTELCNALDIVIEDEGKSTETSLDGERLSISQDHTKYKGLFLLLGSPEFLKHADRDIQLRVGVCICKLLKIFCPCNPLSGLSEEKVMTKEILFFLIDCIGLLSNVKTKTDAVYIKLHTMIYICAQIDVFMWCSFLEDESVLFSFVKMVFAIVKNLDVWSWTDSSIVRQMILDMAVKVIIQSEKFLSSDVVTFILQYLIEPAKSTQPAQHTFARDLIIRTADQLEYRIQMLLQNSLIVGKCNGTQMKTEDSSGGIPDVDESKNDEENPDLLGEHAFLIIYALHTIQSSIVAPILPTIELKLKSPIVRERKRSFRLLARLFSEPNSLLHRRNPSLWDAFLGRFNDIDSEVRKLCIHMLPQLLKQNQDLVHEQLLTNFQQRIYDPDEEVRLLALKTMTGLIKQSENEVSDDAFELLKERSRDKTLSIRKEASSALASLYKGGLQSGCLSASKSASALNTILHLYYQNSTDDKLIVERLLKSSIIPYHFENAVRVQALFRCYSLMDEASIKAMQEIFKTQYVALKLLRDVVKLLTDQRDAKIPSEVNTEIMGVIQHLSILIPKSEKSVEHLKRFFNQVHTDKTLWNHLVKLTKPQTTCAQATTALRDILKKIGTAAENPNSANDNQTNYARVVKILLERCSPVLFDRNFGTELVNQLFVIKKTGCLSGTAGRMNVTRSLRLLLAVSVYFKEILPSNEVMDYLLCILSDEYSSVLNDDNDENVSSSSNSDSYDDSYTLQEMALSILCCVLGGGPSGTFSNTDLTEPLQNIADKQNLSIYAQLTERSEELLPILHRFCCTGIAPISLESCQNRETAEKSIKNNRKTTKHGAKIPSPKLITEAVSNSVVWRRECRRSKLSIRILFCLCNVVRHLLNSKSNSETNNIDLDEESTILENDDLTDELKRLYTLKSKINEILNDIVQVCISCPTLSNDYISCLTSLSHIALLFPDVYNEDIKNFITKSLVQQVLTIEPDDLRNQEQEKDKMQINSVTSKNFSNQPNALSSWSPDSLVSNLTKAKISAIKLITNWLVGLKNEVKPVVQVIIRLLYRIIIHDGDLTKSGKLSYGEMSRLRLVAATSWLKLARSQAYVECIEIGWYLSMSYIICDPCPQVRSHFLTKLNQGLYKLSLPLEYMAIFAHSVNVSEPAFKQRAKQLFIANIQRRRAFLNKHPSYFRDAKFLFGLLPDYVLPYVIYLLSHDSKWTKLDDVEILNKIKSALWFIMEPIMSHGENFSFLRKIIEKIKYARDALHPDDTLINEKLYTVCDISLGLLLSRCINPTIKEYPVDVKLPKTLFTSAPSDFRNPDFKQLINIGSESEAQTGTGIINSPSEMPIKNKVQPLLQFTPNKHTKAFKEGLIPPELVKPKGVNTSKPRKKAKETVSHKKKERNEMEFKTKSNNNIDELSGHESIDDNENSLSDGRDKKHQQQEVISICVASTSSNMLSSEIDTKVCDDVITKTQEVRSSPPHPEAVNNRKKRRKTTPQENLKRPRISKLSDSNSNKKQSTLDFVVKGNEISSNKTFSQVKDTSQQSSSILLSKDVNVKLKKKPESSNAKQNKSRPNKNSRRNIKKSISSKKNDRNISLRSRNLAISENSQKPTKNAERTLHSVNKRPVRSNVRSSSRLKTNKRTTLPDVLSRRPSLRMSAVIARQKLLTPMSQSSSNSTSQVTPKRKW
ncbi:unnamed protein product [Schistosoma rodhaini]|uniref:SCD domain-containing protein n=3 Tax=Schistosoma rodhaini TaxID=6188 RepID=A0AA85FUK8_9TREM|nr:unnamed protein product [Schistosoma rodhaini]CAH8568839.1 unnamed protein product [Schistosoma rodhaini]